MADCGSSSLATIWSLNRDEDSTMIADNTPLGISPFEQRFRSRSASCPPYEMTNIKSELCTGWTSHMTRSEKRKLQNYKGHSTFPTNK